VKELYKNLNNLRGYVNIEEALELVYVARAWKKLSDEGKIKDELTFDNFYSKKVEVKKLASIFKELAKNIKLFSLYSFDTKFLDVIASCAGTKRKEQDGTWILPEVVEAYNALHGMGHAHSVEAYQDGKLVGGAYGVVVGSVFCGESMFAHASDASKAAFTILVKHLEYWGYDFIDCQIPTKHLKSLGAKEVSRDSFLMRMDKSADKHLDHNWQIEGVVINNIYNKRRSDENI